MKKEFEEIERVANAKKLRLLKDSYNANTEKTEKNYKMGLISFQEYLFQLRDIVGLSLAIIEDHKIKEEK